VIIEALKRRKFLWLATKAAKFVALNLEVDREKKTWKLSSKPMWCPELQKRTYADIAAIFKCDPRSFKVTEDRDAKGKFKRFVVET